MPAINFKKEFAEKVRSGEKCQTIRKLRKDGRNPRPGQTLYLYTGMRTKGCQKLGEAICKSVTQFSMEEEGYSATIHIGVSPFPIITMAKDDGFKNAEDFIAFFKNTSGLPFYGLLIKW